VTHAKQSQATIVPTIPPYVDLKKETISL